MACALFLFACLPTRCAIGSVTRRPDGEAVDGHFPPMKLKFLTQQLVNGDIFTGDNAGLCLAWFTLWFVSICGNVELQ